MPPDPRLPEPEPAATIRPPDEPPAQVPLALSDVLEHLIRGAESQAQVSASTRAEAGMAAPQVDELNRRLVNVGRLAGELRAELAALEALRPPDRPVIT
ncbi:hypothetical protein [Geodermatophilus sp. URMC 64]